MIVMEINEVFEQTEEINVYNDGIKITYKVGEDAYNNILENWQQLLEESRLMPAFGVSLNAETVRAMKQGLWVEFVFNEVIECNDLLFEKLLVNAQKDLCGFNLFRYNSDYGYEGRCLYIDLVNKNMDGFYNICKVLC